MSARRRVFMRDVPTNSFEIVSAPRGPDDLHPLLLVQIKQTTPARAISVAPRRRGPRAARGAASVALLTGGRRQRGGMVAAMVEYDRNRRNLTSYDKAYCSQTSRGTPRPRATQSRRGTPPLTSLIEDGLQLVVSEYRNPGKSNRVLPRVSRASGGPMPGLEITDFSALKKWMSWTPFAGRVIVHDKACCVKNGVSCQCTL